jgi:hypothetical protein
MGSGRYFGVKDNLNQTRAVTQVNKYQATVVPAAMHPASQGYLLSNMLRTELATIMALKHITPLYKGKL